jgi:hypothetical protein
MDVTQNRDALIAEIDPEIIRVDLKKLEKDLKVPADQIYIPKVEEIKYTIGMQRGNKIHHRHAVEAGLSG